MGTSRLKNVLTQPDHFVCFLYNLETTLVFKRISFYSSCCSSFLIAFVAFIFYSLAFKGVIQVFFSFWSLLVLHLYAPLARKFSAAFFIQTVAFTWHRNSGKRNTFCFLFFFLIVVLKLSSFPPSFSHYHSFQKCYLRTNREPEFSCRLVSGTQGFYAKQYQLPHGYHRVLFTEAVLLPSIRKGGVLASVAKDNTNVPLELRRLWYSKFAARNLKVSASIHMKFRSDMVLFPPVTPSLIYDFAKHVYNSKNENFHLISSNNISPGSRPFPSGLFSSAFVARKFSKSLPLSRCRGLPLHMRYVTSFCSGKFFFPHRNSFAIEAYFRSQFTSQILQNPLYASKSSTSGNSRDLHRAIAKGLKERDDNFAVQSLKQYLLLSKFKGRQKISSFPLEGCNSDDESAYAAAALKLLRRVKEGYKMEHIFSGVLNVSLRKNSVENTLAVLTMMQAYGFTAQESSFTSLIEQYVSKGLICEAEQVLQVMKEIGVRPKLRSYLPVVFWYIRRLLMASSVFEDPSMPSYANEADDLRVTSGKKASLASEDTCLSLESDSRMACKNTFRPSSSLSSEAFKVTELRSLLKLLRDLMDNGLELEERVRFLLLSSLFRATFLLEKDPVSANNSRQNIAEIPLGSVWPELGVRDYSQVFTSGNFAAKDNDLFNLLDILLSRKNNKEVEAGALLEYLRSFKSALLFCNKTLACYPKNLGEFVEAPLRYVAEEGERASWTLPPSLKSLPLVCMDIFDASLYSVRLQRFSETSNDEGTCSPFASIMHMEVPPGLAGLTGNVLSSCEDLKDYQSRPGVSRISSHKDTTIIAAGTTSILAAQKPPPMPLKSEEDLALSHPQGNVKISPETPENLPLSHSHTQGKVHLHSYSQFQQSKSSPPSQYNTSRHYPHSPPYLMQCPSCGSNIVLEQLSLSNDDSRLLRLGILKLAAMNGSEKLFNMLRFCDILGGVSPLNGIIDEEGASEDDCLNSRQSLEHVACREELLKLDALLKLHNNSLGAETCSSDTEIKFDSYREEDQELHQPEGHHTLGSSLMALMIPAESLKSEGKNVITGVESAGSPYNEYNKRDTCEPSEKIVLEGINMKEPQSLVAKAAQEDSFSAPEKDTLCTPQEGSSTAPHPHASTATTRRNLQSRLPCCFTYGTRNNHLERDSLPSSGEALYCTGDIKESHSSHLLSTLKGRSAFNSSPPPPGGIHSLEQGNMPPSCGFTCILDGANIGYEGQNCNGGYFSYLQIEVVLRELRGLGEWPLIVLPRSYHYHKRRMIPNRAKSKPNRNEGGNSTFYEKISVGDEADGATESSVTHALSVTWKGSRHARKHYPQYHTQAETEKSSKSYVKLTDFDIQLMKRWEEDGCLFICEYGSHDDHFYMLASVFQNVTNFRRRDFEFEVQKHEFAPLLQSDEDDDDNKTKEKGRKSFSLPAARAAFPSKARIGNECSFSQVGKKDEGAEFELGTEGRKEQSKQRKTPFLDKERRRGRVSLDSSRIYVVTNDFLRDHQLAAHEPVAFEKWKALSLIRFHFNHGIPMHIKLAISSFEKLDAVLEGSQEAIHTLNTSLLSREEEIVCESDLQRKKGIHDNGYPTSLRNMRAVYGNTKNPHCKGDTSVNQKASNQRNRRIFLPRLELRWPTPGNLWLNFDVENGTKTCGAAEAYRGNSLNSNCSLAQTAGPEAVCQKTRAWHIPIDNKSAMLLHRSAISPALTGLYVSALTDDSPSSTESDSSSTSTAYPVKKNLNSDAGGKEVSIFLRWLCLRGRYYEDTERPNGSFSGKEALK